MTPFIFSKGDSMHQKHPPAKVAVSTRACAFPPVMSRENRKKRGLNNFDILLTS
jgi:hypothetical protein